MVRLAKALALVITCCAIGCAGRVVFQLAMTTYPSNGAVQVSILVSDLARRQLDSIARRTRETRREQAGCVVGSVAMNAKLVAYVSIAEIEPSNAYSTDSLSVYVAEGEKLCHADRPVLHTHIIPTSVWGEPSPLDLESMEKYSWGAPFHVLLSVTDGTKPDKLTVYGVK